MCTIITGLVQQALHVPASPVSVQDLLHGDFIRWVLDKSVLLLEVL